MEMGVLDPIDGTRSFISGMLIFGTLISLLENDVPIINKRWVGQKEKTCLYYPSQTDKKPVSCTVSNQ